VCARTKGCYNERGSRTNYVRSSIRHCNQYVSADSLQSTGRQLFDSSPSDYRLCGNLKGLVYSVPTENEETPYQRNFYDCQTIRNRSGT
jgi:hypothetical protein